MVVFAQKALASALILGFMTCCSARLTCSKEEYVRTGLEFVKCQDDTIKYYNLLKKTHIASEGAGEDNGPSPCNSLKHIVYNCVEIVRHCFDDRGDLFWW